MVVYEATTKKHFKKIIEFVKAQPESSFVTFCWKHGHKGRYDPEFFKEYKNKFQGLQFFVCEDQDGNIRVVFGRILYSMPNEKRTKSRLLFMENEDYEMGMLKYLKETWSFLIKHDSETYGVKITEGIIPSRYLKFSKEIFGSALKIINSVELPDYGKVSFTSLNVKEASEILS